jgi:hypothetical protein
LTLEQMINTKISFPLITQALELFKETDDWCSGRRLFLGAFIRLGYRDDGLYASDDESLAFGDPQGPSVSDGFFSRPLCAATLYHAMAQHRKGIVERILFRAPSNTFARFRVFKYLMVQDMARLIGVACSVHSGLQRAMNLFAVEDRSTLELLSCHFKVVNILRHRAINVAAFLGQYQHDQPFSDWLEAMTQLASQDGVKRDVSLAYSVDQYGVEGSASEDYLYGRRRRFASSRG